MIYKTVSSINHTLLLIVQYLLGLRKNSPIPSITIHTRITIHKPGYIDKINKKRDKERDKERESHKCSSK